MTKRMLIDAEYIDETRVVVTNENEIEDFDHETARKKQNRGNLYLAKIARVEPSLQAAFVDYGNERHGFLAFSEIHPDYFQIPIADKKVLLKKEEDNNDIDNTDIDEDANFLDKKIPNSRLKILQKYKIQEVIKKGQIILIQVVKEERGNKGAALTTFISLAGRYCVLMPNTIRKGGISRRITNINDRKKLRTIINSLKIPSSSAIIIRTAGSKRTKLEIKRDFNVLNKAWEKIKTTTIKSVAPILVHEENNIIKRSIRDLYNSEISEILVEGDTSYKNAKNYMKHLIPSQIKKIKLYKDKTPLLQKFNVDKILEKIHSPIATLPSGGYIVINQTEALVAVDVNSGRATKERNIEQTALQTNKEAAEELAIQLKLRDLSGLIVIDFIDMLIPKNNRLIENILKQILHTDRAKIQVGSISSFGLLEMSRQRLRPSIYEADFTKCENCDGTGRVRSIESLTLKALHNIEEIAANSKKENLTIDLPKNTAVNILNNKRKEINAIEDKRKINITIIPNSSLNNSEKINLKDETNNVVSEKISKIANKTKNTHKNIKRTNTIKRAKNNNIQNKNNEINKKLNEHTKKNNQIKDVPNLETKTKAKKDTSLKNSTNEKLKKMPKIKENSKIIPIKKKKEKIEKKQVKKKKGPIKTGWWSKETI